MNMALTISVGLLMMAFAVHISKTFTDTFVFKISSRILIALPMCANLFNPLLLFLTIDLFLMSSYHSNKLSGP